MANHSGIVKAKHATLVASTVDTLTFVSKPQGIDVVNLGTDPIYVRCDGTDPTVGGDDTYVVRGAEALVITDDDPIESVKLISVGTPAYHVTRLY